MCVCTIDDIVHAHPSCPHTQQHPPTPNHQGGPRICLGQNLAYMQLQYTLALLVLAFEIEAVDGGAGVAPNHQSATLPMRDGVRVRLTRRAAE